jgi:hypothetical protein
MTVTSSQAVLKSLALVASGAALVFSTAHLRHPPPVDLKAATILPSVSPIASGARDDGSAAITELSRSPATDEFVPVFDIARVGRTGEAVIAGRAAPGAIVELLRNNERHDRVVADQTGQFVIVPPRLPYGNYGLTLRSVHPNGKQAISKQNVVVALAEVEPSAGALNSHAEMPQISGSTQAHNASLPHSQTAKPQDIADSKQQYALAANSLPDGGSQGARFAAMSVTKDQGVRAIISNVVAPTKGIALAPCLVQVSFFGADGSLIGNATTVQLKAGESASVPASNPSKLVRANVSIGDVVDPTRVCALRTTVELFDVQTGTTFVSIPGEFIGINSERSVPAAPVVGSERKRGKRPVLAATPPIGQK